MPTISTAVSRAPRSGVVSLFGRMVFPAPFGTLGEPLGDTLPRPLSSRKRTGQPKPSSQPAKCVNARPASGRGQWEKMSVDTRPRGHATTDREGDLLAGTVSYTHLTLPTILRV